MKLLLPSCIAFLFFTLAGSTSFAATPPTPLIDSIENSIEYTWHRQRVMGTSLTPTARTYLKTQSKPLRRWILRKWRRQMKQVRLQFFNPPYLGSWHCIHGGEGAWNSNTGNDYFGGLQMDMEFQRTYGSYLLRLKGTANNWTPLEQIWVAEKARRNGRGFYPWPTTAENCGLI